jgi:hypothetical protein
MMPACAVLLTTGSVDPSVIGTSMSSAARPNRSMIASGTRPGCRRIPPWACSRGCAGLRDLAAGDALDPHLEMTWHRRGPSAAGSHDHMVDLREAPGQPASRTAGLVAVQASMTSVPLRLGPCVIGGRDAPRRLSPWSPRTARRSGGCTESRVPGPTLGTSPLPPALGH